MKKLFSILCLSLFIMSCQPKPDTTADDLFKKNSETVLANIEGWQNENLDYSMYAKDFVMNETAFSAERDSSNLEQMMADDKMLWEHYDFKILTNPPILLPGVDKDTKKADGSVRHYSDWEVTLPATDSTEAKSGVIKLYESFDFDADGKIVFQQVYGDFTGVMMYLHTPSDMGGMAEGQ
jgi:hypothetical protein